ncbi:acyl-CoA N-acyltransferase [Dentipellis sp. KUC8613]|nr:acyl-CoA N-acyltransferase [Dentipellis sp. KUC8613]
MFTSAQLQLRAFRKSDLDDMIASLNTYDVQRTAVLDYVVPRPEGFKRDMEGWVERCTLFVVAVDKESGKYVGDVCLWTENVRDRDALVGIQIRPEHWGKGYGKEMMGWVVDYAFKGLGMHRLTLTVVETNTRARALYGKLGFAEEIVHRKKRWFEGRWVDEITMGVLEDDFLAAQKK